LKSVLFLAVSVLAATPALAQEADPATDITVVATGLRQPVDQTGQAISVVVLSEIQAIQSPFPQLTGCLDPIRYFLQSIQFGFTISFATLLIDHY